MSQVFRCYVEKRPGFDVEAEKVLRELRDQLGIAGLTGLRLFNRYDVEGVDEAVYQAAKTTVFSEPQCDDIYDENLPALAEGTRPSCWRRRARWRCSPSSCCCPFSMAIFWQSATAPWAFWVYLSKFIIHSSFGPALRGLLCF